MGLREKKKKYLKQTKKTFKKLLSKNGSSASDEGK